MAGLTTGSLKQEKYACRNNIARDNVKPWYLNLFLYLKNKLS